VHARRRLIRMLHASPWQGALIVTGGGSLLLSDLLSVPGASATVLDAQVPYAATTLAQVLGAMPDQACAAATASDLATVAFQRALELGRAGRQTPDGCLTPGHAFGFAITASLRTTRRKRGLHRAYFAVQTLASSWCVSLTLDRQARSRLQEERLVRDVALWTLARALDLAVSLPLALVDGDRLEVSDICAPTPWQQLLLGRTPAVPQGAGTRPRILFPGAFNPLHDGHRAVARHAAATLGQPVAYEICAINVDKPRLNYLTLQQRLSQFDAASSVWITNLPTFREKARYFPGVTFLVGIDTLARIGDLRYYRHDALQLSVAMQEIAHLGCRFLVFGRRIGDQFTTLEDVVLPPSLARLCDAVPADAFRYDVSSTELRQRGSALARRD
jgi:hypothetical protein